MIENKLMSDNVMSPKMFVVLTESHRHYYELTILGNDSIKTNPV